MVSVGPTQEACIRRVEYFLERRDAYNAREALKDVDDGPEANRLFEESVIVDVAEQIAAEIEKQLWQELGLKERHA